jgi:thiol-disulfide isomerase/thioredoxin
MIKSFFYTWIPAFAGMTMLIALLCSSSKTASAEEPMQITNLHNTIVSQSGWLNTSRPLKAEDLQGRIILLDFWTYCCINCMHVIPDLHYLEEKFGKDLTVIGVHSAKFANERDSENIRNAILRYDLQHPVVNDFDFKVWKKFGINAWPTFVLINPQGIIEQTYSGEGNREKVAADIEKLKQKYAGEINSAPLPIALEKDKTPPSVLSFPGKLDYAADKKLLIVSDSGHQQIVLMTMDGKIMDTIGSGKIGNKDGDFTSADFNTPQGVLYKDGKIYIADTNNHTLRLADLGARTVTTLAGTGKQGFERAANNADALKTPLASPWDLAFYPDDKHIAIAMAGTHQIWSYDIDKKTVSVIAGNGQESIDNGKYPFNSLAQTSGLSAVGEKLYFVDAETSSLRVLENGEVRTLIGTGLFDFGYKEGVQGEARMQHPLGLYADEKNVFIADAYNHSIRRYDIATGTLHNYAGHGVRGNKDGQPMAAEFNEPNDLSKIGNALYIADTNNNAIRTIDLNSGTVTTLNIPKPETVAAAEFATDLPNTETLAPMEITESATVSIGLQKTWHINDEAPSNLTVFDAKKKAVKRFSLDEIKTRTLQLPTLAAGEYHLQATLYYCENKAGSQCLIKSFDQVLNVQKGGKKNIPLKLN